MNNDVENLLIAKKEKIDNWLESLNSDDDILWIQKSKAFATTLYNIIYSLVKIQSSDTLKKQEELINTIGSYINTRDRVKVKNIVNKLKELEEEKEMNDNIDFNNIDKMMEDIDSKLEELKEEELEGKSEEEQKKILEEWEKEELEWKM